MILGPVLEAAFAAQTKCEKLGLPSCVIGGVALQRWGEPRFTADADISVLVEPGEEGRVARALLEELPARIADALEFAARTRVVLVRSEKNVGIDIVLAGLPFEARVISRATPWPLGEGVSLRTCSPEDLVIMKVFAARDKDWADVTSILERQGAKLDFDLIRGELAPLLDAKGEPELADELERRIRKHGQNKY